MKITIQQDGGCRGNPGAMYGSYFLKFDGAEAFRASRIELGHGTNNMAEFLILVEAIKKTIELLEVAGIDPRIASVQILSDSQIVVNRVSLKKVDTAKSLAKADRLYGPGSADRARAMGELAQKCVLPLLRFKSYRIDWHPREQNVEAFGH